jgi:hypothetical protein
MKTDGDKWMEWLHEYRAAQERKRRELGVDEVEWMKRTTKRARELLAELPKREQPTVARDMPAAKPRRRRKP